MLVRGHQNLAVPMFADKRIVVLNQCASTQVDTNIKWLSLELPDTPEEEHHMGRRLKERKLQPKELGLLAYPNKNSNRGAALAAAGLDFFMQRVEQVYLHDTLFPAGVGQLG
jgi:hypothetical protein